MDRDTDVLPLAITGDSVWIDGERAAHRVDRVGGGTRITLCIGMLCPGWYVRPRR